MTTYSGNAETGAGQRKKIDPGTVAALWVISNGSCYAPDCPVLVVSEVRPGVYRKNSQVAHIYGVSEGGPRYRSDMTAAERDSFGNLLLLCLAHHADVDGPDWQLFPPETLRGWKEQREGKAGAHLGNLRWSDPEKLFAVLVSIAEPAVSRLESIALRLERTGTVTAEIVAELRMVIGRLQDAPETNAHTARLLSEAAQVFGGSAFHTAARNLAYAAEALPSRMR
jgi:hypothetical protein